MVLKYAIFCGYQQVAALIVDQIAICSETWHRLDKNMQDLPTGILWFVWDE